MTALAPPRRQPAAVLVAPLIALLLVGIAVVSVRDLFVAQGWASGTTWTGAALEALDGLTATWWVVTTGIVLALVGLVLVVVALTPRRRSHHPTALDGDVWVTSAALSAVAASAAEETPGVAGAVARVKRGRVAVTVQSHEPSLQPVVEANVLRRLHGFTDRPVHVTVEKVKDDA